MIAAAAHWICSPQPARRPSNTPCTVGRGVKKQRDTCAKRWLSMLAERLLLRSLAVVFCLALLAKSVSTWQTGAVAKWASLLDGSSAWANHGGMDGAHRGDYWYCPICNISYASRYPGQSRALEWGEQPDDGREADTALVPLVQQQISAPLLAHVVQEVTDLCYQLAARFSELEKRMARPTKSPKFSPRNHDELSQRITQLQLCVSHLRNITTPSITDPPLPWRDRFQTLDAFAEHYEPTKALKPGFSKEIVEAMQQSETGEWLNFAEAGNGAKVFAANAEAKKPNRAIDGKMDSFLFNECSVKGGMWLVIELSHTARVKVIRLVMRELYSSRIKDFSVFGQLVPPVKDILESPASFHVGQWDHMGDFTAANVKGAQEFPVHHNAWVKFLGLHFKSYHGMEKACTINEVGIFGVAPEQDHEAFLVADNEDIEGTLDVDDRMEAVSTTRKDPKANHGETWTNLHKSDSKIAQAKELIASGMTEGKLKQPLPELKVPSKPGNPPLNLKITDEGSLGEVHVPGNELEGGGGGGIGVGASDNLGGGWGNSTGDSSSSREPPAVAAYKKIRQDLQSLRRNNSMLATYVDSLRGGLMDTIDELWQAIGRVENKTSKFEEGLLGVEFAIESIEGRLDRLEASALRRSEIQVKVLVGIFGLLFGMGGVILLAATRSRAGPMMYLIWGFSVANFLAGSCNILSVALPIIKCNRLYGFSSCEN